MALSREKQTQIDQVRSSVSQSKANHPLFRDYVDLNGEIKRLDYEHLLRHDSFPIPSPVDREGYLPEYDHHYWASGHIDWLNIQSAVNEFAIRPQKENRKLRLLDVGCATGRVLRHVHVFGSDKFEAWGTDLAPANVEWVKRHLPKAIQVSHNLSSPPLDYPDGFFDVVTGFSVIPHIDQLEREWLAELNRVTKPAGLLLLTVGNEATWAVAATRENTIQHFANSNHIEGNEEFSKSTFENPLLRDRVVRRLSTAEVYNCFIWHSNRYIMEQWSDFLQVDRIVDLAHMRYQSVLLARPKQINHRRT